MYLPEGPRCTRSSRQRCSCASGQHICQEPSSPSCSPGWAHPWGRGLSSCGRSRCCYEANPGQHPALQPSKQSVWEDPWWPPVSPVPWAQGCSKVPSMAKEDSVTPTKHHIPHQRWKHPTLKPTITGRKRKAPPQLQQDPNIPGCGWERARATPRDTGEEDVDCPTPPWAGPTWGAAQLGAHHPGSRRQRSPGSSPAPP